MILRASMIRQRDWLPAIAQVKSAFEIVFRSRAAPKGLRRTVTVHFLVTFEQVVQDDRCPVGVFCIHFGDARVAFRARGAGSDTTVVLSTADTAAPAAIGPYRLELQALAPFKQQETAIPAAAYRATIRVSRSE